MRLDFTTRTNASSRLARDEALLQQAQDNASLSTSVGRLPLSGPFATLDKTSELHTIMTMIQLLQYNKAKDMSDEKLNFQLDFHSGLPIYTQIANQIQGRVANGILKPGDQLPTVRALALELRVNFNTVARAYRLLDEERIISTQQGRGTYITEKPPPKVTERLRRESLDGLTQRFVSEALRLGFSQTEIRQIVSEQLKS
jgi:GntR family transcriptional regulator